MRLDSLNSSSALSNEFYVQPFQAYTDYDFRNDQALSLMEDLFWEAPFPTFTFYDYLMLSDFYKNGSLVTPTVAEMTNLFTPSNTSKSLDETSSDLEVKDKAFTTLHSDDPFLSSNLLTSKSVSLLSALSETQDFDDTYTVSKTQTFLTDSSGTRPLLSQNFNNFFTSSVKTFSNFTTSHTPFNSSLPDMTLVKPQSLLLTERPVRPFNDISATSYVGRSTPYLLGSFKD